MSATTGVPRRALVRLAGVGDLLSHTLSRAAGAPSHASSRLMGRRSIGPEGLNLSRFAGVREAEPTGSPQAKSRAK